MNQKWINHVAKWLRRNQLLLSVCCVPVFVLSFLLVEHMRGSVSLALYLRDRRAKGEILSARDFRRALPPGENGAPDVLAAAKDLRAGAVLPKYYPPRMRLTPAGHAVICFREEEWVDDRVTNHWEQLKADVEANAETLNIIRNAMAQPVLDCAFDPSLGPRARFPHLVVPKTLALWFGSRIQLRLHEGKIHDIVPDLVTEIDLPRLLARDKIVISELVRIAVAAVARGDTWEALQADGWADDDLAAIQHAWERQGFATLMCRALEGEIIFGDSSFQLMRNSNQETADIFFGMDRFLADDERPGWERTLSNLPGGEAFVDFLKRQVYCRVWRFAWLDQDELRYFKYMQHFIALGQSATRDKSLNKLEPEVNELMLKFENRTLYNRLRFRSELFINSLSRVFTRALRAETERSLILAAIAIKRHELQHRAFPQSLTTLVPDILPSVPVDYMDGQSVRFRHQPDGSYVLYSVGEDAKDDGGDSILRPDKTNVRMIWERKDVVWPSPATAEELRTYRIEAGKH